MPLGQRPGDNGESRYAGRELEYDSDIQLSLSSSLGGGFDFIVAPLVSVIHFFVVFGALELTCRGGGEHTARFFPSYSVFRQSNWPF